MIDKTIEFFGINIGVLTISDTRNFDNDKSGIILKSLIEDYGHTCILRDIVKDDPTEILLILNKWINNKNLDVIITTKLRTKYFNGEGLEKTIGIPGPFNKRIRIHPHNSSYGSFYDCNGIDDLIYNHSVKIDKIKFVELKFFLMYKKDRLYISRTNKQKT